MTPTVAILAILLFAWSKDPASDPKSKNTASDQRSQTQRDAPVARPAGTGTITGVVRTADENGAPVRLARVTLNSVERGGAAETATTDAEGRFTFRQLPAGRYSLQASKRAWLDASFGATRPGRAGTAIAVRDGETVGNVELRLSRGAVIAGTIRDPSGEPQPGLTVRVLQFVTRDGMRALERPLTMNVNDPLTDDEGAYRIYGLPPGEYLVVAGVGVSGGESLGRQVARQLSVAEIDRIVASGSEPAGPTVTSAPVYFPGTTDMSAAATVTLAPGQERLGVDIPFALYPAARVSGTVTLPPALVGTSAPGRRAELRITPAGFEDLLLQPIGDAVTSVDPDGRFLFPAVPPGRYTVTTVLGSPGGRPGEGIGLAGFASVPIVVAGDLEISLSMAPGSRIAGRLVFEGASPPKDPSAEFQVSARGLGAARLLRPQFNARPQADGTFAFDAIVIGRWTFSVTAPRTSPWSLKSFTLGGREVEDFIEVHPGQAVPELVLTLTDRPSELSGTLQDAGGRPASDYFVIAFAADPRMWTPVSRRIQSTRPASDGAYSIKGLPLGDYYLAALTDVEPNEWLSPAFLEQIVGASVRVRINDSAKTVQNLRIAR